MSEFNFSINPAQAETLSTLTRALGPGTIEGFGNGGSDGPIYFAPEPTEEGFLVLSNGDTVSPKVFEEQERWRD
jgi:hypothetical protein